MSQTPWTQYPKIPWLFYAPCGCQHGGYYIHDQRLGQTFKTPDMNGVHQYAADHSGQGSRFRLGDAVHRLTKAVGMQRCGSCARRQTAMNRWFD